jgi:hypothetical protein
VFTVVVPVLNQHDETKRFVQTWFERAKGEFRLLFIDNGSRIPIQETDFFREWKTLHPVECLRNETNVGVYPTFQQAAEIVDSEFIFYTHNDVEMIEFGWDEKLNQILSTIKQHHGTPGVCGMFGAKGIGSPDIYKAPYHFTQMVRWDCLTVESMVGAGGRRLNHLYERVMVLDGFSLIVSREMIARALGGRFDCDRYPVHHMYDQDICLGSHFGGFANYAIDLDCRHHGGITSTREKWAEGMGSTDLKIHREAHRVFYEKYRGRLPVGV